jgi:hypothetical protein
MRPLSYYQETSVSIPKKDDYMTIYYYRKGVMVGMKVGKVEDDFQPPKNCVEEKVLDEISFNAHMKHYQEEAKRLQEEFRKDLIAEYKMTHHPKANKLFDKAWDINDAIMMVNFDPHYRSYSRHRFLMDQVINVTSTTDKQLPGQQGLPSGHVEQLNPHRKRLPEGQQEPVVV